MLGPLYARPTPRGGQRLGVIHHTKHRHPQRIRRLGALLRTPLGGNGGPLGALLAVRHRLDAPARRQGPPAARAPSTSTSCDLAREDDAGEHRRIAEVLRDLCDVGSGHARSPASVSQFRDNGRHLAAHRAGVVKALGAITAYVFVHIGKGPLRGQRMQELNKAWRSASRRGGYTGILLHDLRRSGVRAMVRSGVPESVAQRLGGPRPPRSSVATRHHHRDQDLRRDARDRRARFGRESDREGREHRALSCWNHNTEASRNPVGLPDFKSGVRL